MICNNNDLEIICNTDLEMTCNNTDLEMQEL
jgi:hypothetical protein